MLETSLSDFEQNIKCIVYDDRHRFHAFFGGPHVTPGNYGDVMDTHKKQILPPPRDLRNSAFSGNNIVSEIPPKEFFSAAAAAGFAEFREHVGEHVVLS